MKNKNKIIILVLSILCITITGFTIYEITTRNNTYYISEKNLEIPIFVYHNIVDDESQVYYDYMQTTKEVFENQIKGLKNMGYHFITYNDLREYKEGKKEIYKKSCILTFDDGYEEVYKNAYPIADKYDIPFTMFIITDNVGKPGTITWEEAREMQNSGLVTIASHSENHAEFNKLTVNEAVDNVNRSYEKIESNISINGSKIFTYPYGLYTDEEINELTKLGYIQNLTDNKINKSKNLDLSRLHRCYPLSDSTSKIMLKIMYRSFRYS